MQDVAVVSCEPRAAWRRVGNDEPADSKSFAKGQFESASQDVNAVDTSITSITKLPLYLYVNCILELRTFTIGLLAAVHFLFFWLLWIRCTVSAEVCNLGDVQEHLGPGRWACWGYMTRFKSHLQILGRDLCFGYLSMQCQMYTLYTRP